MASSNATTVGHGIPVVQGDDPAPLCDEVEGSFDGDALLVRLWIERLWPFIRRAFSPKCVIWSGRSGSVCLIRHSRKRDRVLRWECALSAS